MGAHEKQKVVVIWTLVVSVLGIFFLNTASAQQQCRNLKNIMEDMRLEYRYITKNFRNSSQSVNVIASSERFHGFVEEASACPPNLSLQEIQQYRKLLQQVIAENQVVKKSVQEENYDVVQKALQNIYTLMKEGHEIFD